ncbi:hypothetical protein LTR08_002126 [Meristemomyces frigidus]|nr:hypothetical protein LTR08_002126 [Meristemomyces frigidus]
MAETAQTEFPKRQWFNADLTVSDSTRQVLTTYSKIPADQILSHVHAVREKAWAVHPYPCIGQGRFLELAIGQHELYQAEILPRMRQGEQTYLDLGCAFAQNIRRLVADGVDSGKCYGADITLDLIGLGYELFQDKETLKSKFIAADIFDADSQLKELEGTIDIIDASSFFHLFGLEEQKTIARAVMKLMTGRKDSLVVGRQAGTVKNGLAPNRLGVGNKYWHNIESWRKLWDEVGDEVGVQFQVEGRSKPIANTGRESTAVVDAGWSMLEFSVRRMN